MEKSRFLPAFGAAAILGITMLPIAACADTSASSSPYIQTSTTPNGGVTVNMELPNNFKGQVYTVYKDGQWQTYSTTTPLSSADITSMQSEIAAEQASMQRMFAEQEQLFEQEQQMFQNMFGSF